MDGTDSFESSLDFCLSSKPGFVSSDDSTVATDALLVSLVAIVVRLLKLLNLLVRMKLTRVYIARNFMIAPTYFPIPFPITDCMCYKDVV